MDAFTDKFLCCLMLVLSPFILSAQEVPYLSGRVNDYAHLLSEESRQQLESTLQDHEQRTSNQIVVLTIPSLEGEDIAAFAVRTAETWQLGQNEKDNGVLLLVAAQDRKLRIEVGYGLEPYLTDADASRIIRDIIVPYFRDENYQEGIVKGTEAILAKIEGIEELSETTSQSDQDSGGGFGIFTFLLAIVSAISGFFLVKRRRRNAPRKSEKTGLPMHKLGEKEEDVHLSQGQQTEEKIGSIDYDVWISEQPGDVLILPYKNNFNRKFSKCPQCGYITFYHKGSTIHRSATYAHDGEGERQYACKHCNYSEKRQYRIPRLRRTQTVIIPGGGISSGGGGFSGGGFSGGGGSFGGGGASGSW